MRSAFSAKISSTMVRGKLNVPLVFAGIVMVFVQEKSLFSVALL